MESVEHTLETTPFDSSEAFWDPIDRGDGTIIRNDMRLLRVAMLAPYSIEVKNPECTEDLYGGQFVPFLRDALAKPHVTDEDILATMTDVAGGIFEPFKHTTFDLFTIRNIYESIGIHPEELVLTTRRIMQDIIADFGLPQDLEQRLTRAVTDVEVDLDVNVRTELLYDKDDIEKISFDLAGVLLWTNFLSALIKTPATSHTVKTIFIMNLAHEMGHLLDVIPYWQNGEVHHPLVSSGIVPHDPDFPIQYKDIHYPSHDKNWGERFATYFEKEAVRRMGLPVEIQEDYRRSDLSLSLYFLRTVPPRRMSLFLESIRQALPENDVHREVVEELYKIALEGHSIATSFPFARDQILEGLLESTRHTQLSLVREIERHPRKRYNRKFIIDEEEDDW